MSSWARQQPAGQGGGILSKIPGYAGYREKESRRDQDKRVRLELARQYDLIAQRLTDVQGELVRAQRFAEIGNVERLERTLRLFTDRLRTATYGYAGLFSDQPVEDRALAQLAAFDDALGDGLDALKASVEAVSAAAAGTGDLGQQIRATQALIDGLNRRFDLRSQAIESGQVVEGAGAAGGGVSDVFSGTPGDQAHVTSDLHFGDAVSISGTDYLVQGRMEFHTDATAWRQYLLRDGNTEAWLHVPPSTAEPMALLQRAPEFPGESALVTVGGVPYTQMAAGTATAEVIGEAGKRSNQPVRFRRFGGEAGAALFAYDWGAERQTLTGRTLDPLEVKVYPRP